MAFGPLHILPSLLGDLLDGYLDDGFSLEGGGSRNMCGKVGNGLGR